MPTSDPRPRDIRLAVFDFDGTLSWIRHGWPSLFAQVVEETLPRLPGESAGDLHALLVDETMKLNGAPTLFQGRRAAELHRERGAPARDPEEIVAVYQARLDDAIERRAQAVRSGAAAADDYVVHGAKPFLRFLKERHPSIRLAVLSSTVQERVREEARVLGLDTFFGPDIFGGTGDPVKFTKRAVFERLLNEEKIEGRQLLAFGDGPVEIRETKSLGGIAIAVCSDEHHNGSGISDPCKEQLLRAAGADDAIPDYRSAAEKMEAWLCR